MKKNRDNEYASAAVGAVLLLFLLWFVGTLIYVSIIVVQNQFFNWQCDGRGGTMSRLDYEVVDCSCTVVNPDGTANVTTKTYPRRDIFGHNVQTTLCEVGA